MENFAEQVCNHLNFQLQRPLYKSILFPETRAILFLLCTCANYVNLWNSMRVKYIKLNFVTFQFLYAKNRALVPIYFVFSPNPKNRATLQRDRKWMYIVDPLLGNRKITKYLQERTLHNSFDVWIEYLWTGTSHRHSEYLYAQGGSYLLKELFKGR